MIKCAQAILVLRHFKRHLAAKMNSWPLALFLLSFAFILGVGFLRKKSDSELQSEAERFCQPDGSYVFPISESLIRDRSMIVYGFLALQIIGAIASYVWGLRSEPNEIGPFLLGFLALGTLPLTAFLYFQNRKVDLSLRVRVTATSISLESLTKPDLGLIEMRDIQSISKRLTTGEGSRSVMNTALDNATQGQTSPIQIFFKDGKLEEAHWPWKSNVNECAYIPATFSGLAALKSVLIRIHQKTTL